MAKRRQKKVISISLSAPVKEHPRLKTSPNAPPVLVSLCHHMRSTEALAKAERAQIITQAKRAGQKEIKGLPGLSRALPLLEKLLTSPEMDYVWGQLNTTLLDKTTAQQDVVYSSLWDMIHHAFARHQSLIATRRELGQAIRNIGKGLQLIGEAIAPYRPGKNMVAKRKPWPGLPSSILWGCLPNDLAEVLEHWAPNMELVAFQANQKAQTILATPRAVDREGYSWSKFIRLVKSGWPSDLESLCTNDVLARIARTLLPDCSVTERQVRDTLRRQ